MIIIAHYPGFPRSVENMGGSSKFDERGWGLSQYMGGAWGGGVKMLSKIPVKEFI